MSPRRTRFRPTLDPTVAIRIEEVSRDRRIEDGQIPSPSKYPRAARFVVDAAEDRVVADGAVVESQGTTSASE